MHISIAREIHEERMREARDRAYHAGMRAEMRAARAARRSSNRSIRRAIGRSMIRIGESIASDAPIAVEPRQPAASP